MKLIYTHQNPVLASNVKNLLEEAGIPCTLRNEFASGGVGELSFVDAWPEVWILNDNHYQKAAQIISEIKISSGNWTCPNCNETNDNSFETCWHCGANAPEDNPVSNN